MSAQAPLRRSTRNLKLTEGTVGDMTNRPTEKSTILKDWKSSKVARLADDEALMVLVPKKARKTMGEATPSMNAGLAHRTTDGVPTFLGWVESSGLDTASKTSLKSPLPVQALVLLINVYLTPLTFDEFSRPASKSMDNKLKARALELKDIIGANQEWADDLCNDDLENILKNLCKDCSVKIGESQTRYYLEINGLEGSFVMQKWEFICFLTLLTHIKLYEKSMKSRDFFPEFGQEISSEDFKLHPKRLLPKETAPEFVEIHKKNKRVVALLTAKSAIEEEVNQLTKDDLEVALVVAFARYTKAGVTMFLTKGSNGTFPKIHCVKLHATVTKKLALQCIGSFKDDELDSKLFLPFCSKPANLPDESAMRNKLMYILKTLEN